MIKFITEEYLRDLYRKEPFSIYQLNKEERLTPGARQYLSDKGIKIEEKIFQVDIKNSEQKQSNRLLNKKKDLKKKLCLRLKYIESVFLINASEILDNDIILAQNVIYLGRKISNVRNVIEGVATLENINCKACTGISTTNFNENIDECFEVTDFHIHLKNGKNILKINSLSCYLRELELEVIDAYEEDDDIVNRIIGNINSIINSLSQMICSTAGGVKCQREK